MEISLLKTISLAAYHPMPKLQFYIAKKVIIMQTLHTKYAKKKRKYANS